MKIQQPREKVNLSQGWKANRSSLPLLTGSNLYHQHGVSYVLADKNARIEVRSINCQPALEDIFSNMDEIINDFFGAADKFVNTRKNGFWNDMDSLLTQNAYIDGEKEVVL